MVASVRNLVLSGALIFLSACTVPIFGGDSLSKSEEYAVEACDLKLLDSNVVAGEVTNSKLDSKKKWSSPSLTNEETWSYSDSIDRIKRIRRAWAERVPSSAAAAQEDPAFDPLIESVTQALQFVDAVLAAKGDNLSSATFNQRHDASEYNDSLARFRNECSGLSLRLNSR